MYVVTRMFYLYRVHYVNVSYINIITSFFGLDTYHSNNHKFSNDVFVSAIYTFPFIICKRNVNKFDNLNIILKSVFWEGSKCLLLGAVVSFQEGPKCLNQRPKCRFQKVPNFKCPIRAEMVETKVAKQFFS